MFIMMIEPGFFIMANSGNLTRCHFAKMDADGIKHFQFVICEHRNVWFRRSNQHTTHEVTYLAKFLSHLRKLTIYSIPSFRNRPEVYRTI